MVIYVAAYSPQGQKTAERLEKQMGERARQRGEHVQFRWRREVELLEHFAGEAFHYHLPIISVGAAGICVRMCAPFVEDKTTDSAVLVVDDAGHYVIPILSGHLGGANDLAEEVAAAIGGVPVITTASDMDGSFAADVFARHNALAIRNREGILAVAKKSLAGEKISVVVDPDIRIAAPDPADGKLIEMKQIGQSQDTAGIWPEADIIISSHDPSAETGDQESVSGADTDHGEDADRQKTLSMETVANRPKTTGTSRRHCTLWLSPKTVTVGIGCRRGRTFEDLNAFLLRIIQLTGQEDPEEYMRLHVRAIATIDRKADEEGLQILAQYWHLPLITCSAAELKAVPGIFHTSEFVKKTVGVSNVCERAAVRAADVYGGGHLILPEQAYNGMTMAIAEGHAGIGPGGTVLSSQTGGGDRGQAV